MKLRASMTAFCTLIMALALMVTGCPQTTDPDPVAATGITINLPTPVPAYLRVAGGAGDYPDTITLGATVTPTDAADKSVAWSSSSDSIATVVAGIVTAVGPGNVIITAKANGGTNITDTFAIVVLGASETVKPVESVSITEADFTLAVRVTKSLTATVLPEDATNKNVIWSTSDDNVATVSNAGVVTGVSGGEATITVTTVGLKADTTAATDTVMVTVEAPPVLTVYNMSTEVETATTQATLVLNDANKYDIKGNGIGTSKLDSSGFVDALFIHYDRAFTGDFKLRARVKMTDLLQQTTSTAKGLFMGGIAVPETGNFIISTKFTGLMFRTGGGTAGTVNTSAIRGYWSRHDGSQAVGVNHLTPWKTEYVFEVSRNEAAGITLNVYNGKTYVEGGENALPILVVTSTQTTEGEGNNLGHEDIRYGQPLYPGFALMGVSAEISQISLYDSLEPDATPIATTPVTVASPVEVAGVTIGVTSGGTVTPITDGTYFAKVTEATVSGIDFAAIIEPDYADNKTVKWYAESVTPEDSIAINETTGKVTITAEGSATISVVSQDAGAVMGSIELVITGDYVPVDDFTITGAKTEIDVGFTAAYSTDIPATVTSPVVVWTITSGNTYAKFLDDTNEVTTVTGPSATLKGLVAGSVTIRATATTTNNTTPTTKYAEKTITIEAASGSIYSWAASAADSFNLTSSSASAVVNGATWTRTGGTITSNGADGFTLANGRFTIGTEKGASPTTTDTVYDTDAIFDFTQKAKVTIQYKNGTAGANLILYVNNNTSSASASNSPHGANSRINFPMTNSATVQDATYTIDPSVLGNPTALATSFIQIRAESSTSAVITGITIEYVD
jgi:uncharacterized protein YjdB